MDFENAFDRVISSEGGYVNDPRDPGGETRYGISKRAYPHEDIPGMTLERAKQLYKRDYWDAIKGDQMPYDVAVHVFDTAVNCGVATAARMLQKALGVQADGVLGPFTLSTAQAIDPARFAAKFNAERLDYYAALPTWPAYGKGWVKRVANQLRSI